MNFTFNNTGLLIIYTISAMFFSFMIMEITAPKETTVENTLEVDTTSIDKRFDKIQYGIDELRITLDEIDSINKQLEIKLESAKVIN